MSTRLKIIALAAAVAAVAVLTFVGATFWIDYRKEHLSSAEMKIMEDGVKKRLNDPDSAKFSDIHIKRAREGAWLACGFVNARNKFGGYVGNSLFFGSFSDGNFKVLYLDGPEWPEDFRSFQRKLCRESTGLEADD